MRTSSVPLALLFGLAGCLEKTTGEFVPLDAAYTAGHTDDQSDPNKGGTGDGVWPGLKEPRLHITGEIKSADNSPVQIDVNIDDPSGDNGQSRVGALHLDNGPGAFEFYAPVDVTLIHLQAFQDPAVDGPSEGDPFARADIKLSGKDPELLILTLDPGNRGQPDGGGGAPPPQPGGAASGGGQGPQPSGPGSGAPMGPNAFPGVTEFVSLSGTVTGPSPAIVVDFFKVDPAGQGGRTHLMKVETSSGAWAAKFPKDYGKILIEAFVDPQHDGPTQGDPMVVYPGNPVTVGPDDTKGLSLVIPG